MPAPLILPADRAAVVDRICVIISAGDLVRHACETEGITASTLRDWCHSDASLSAQYARAREEQSHALAEKLMDIAAGTDTDGQDRLEAIVCAAAGEDDADARDSVLASLQNVAVQRDRLRVDTLKWYVSKIAPKLYGERAALEVEHSGGLTVTIRREGRRVPRALDGGTVATPDTIATPTDGET